METFGAQCIASPSDTTQSGRPVLAELEDLLTPPKPKKNLAIRPRRKK